MVILVSQAGLSCQRMAVIAPLWEAIDKSAAVCSIGPNGRANDDPA